MLRRNQVLACTDCKDRPELGLVEDASSYDLAAHCPACGFNAEILKSFQAALKKLPGDPHHVFLDELETGPVLPTAPGFHGHRTRYTTCDVPEQFRPANPGPNAPAVPVAPGNGCFSVALLQFLKILSLREFRYDSRSQVPDTCAHK